MRLLRNAVLGLAALAIGATASVDVQAQFRRPSIATFPGSDQTQLRNLMMGYISPGIVNQHATNTGTIHCENTLFLTWHREYVEAMEAWLMTQDWGSKYVPLPKWRPDINPIPNAFFNGGSVMPPFDNPLLANQDITNWALNNNPGGNYQLSQYITPNVCANYPAGALWRACIPWNLQPNNGTALDNFALALENDHNWVHGNVGGVMNDAQNSPAAAIFWLWHADVDDYYRYYQCQCGLAPAKDLFMKDNPADIGAQPNTSVTNGVYWESPDIWVRQDPDVSVGSYKYQEQDRINRHQNPEYKALGGDNYIYVRVRNIGCQATTATDVKLRVYWSKWSPGVWQWQNDWITPPQGSEITSGPGISVPAMQPGDVKVIEVPWTVPDPSLYPVDPHHFCLLARLESAADPMAVTEGTDVWTNTRNNNNIAWRNVQVFNNNPFNIAPPGWDEGFIKFFVGATRGDQNDAVVRVDFPDITGIHVTLDLGEELYALWEEGGLQGEGVTPLEEYRVRIDQPGATIRGLALPMGEVYRPAVQAYIRVNREGGEAGVKYGDIVPVRITQYETTEDGEEALTGGITYEINNQPSEDETGELIHEVEIVNPGCPESADGSIAIHGGDDYTYWWSNGSSESQIDGLTPGTYSVVVRNGDGLVEERVFDLATNSTLEVEMNATGTTCGQANGSASVAVVGGMAPYRYQWYREDGSAIEGATGTRISNVSRGIYRVEVRDKAGCAINGKVPVLAEMSMLSVGTSKTDASSADAADGSAEAHATGMGPFTYAWSNGSAEKRITGLRPGTYTVTITDMMGCRKTTEAVITSPEGRAQQSTVTDWESGASLMKILSVVPNPASDQAQLSFTLVEPGTVRVEIYDELGKLVKFVEEASRLGGTNSVRIDTRTLTSGRYSLRLAIGNRGISTPLVIVR